MKNAALQRGGGGLGAVAGFQFRENVADVLFHGDFGNLQRAANFLVAPAPGDQFQDLGFARGEFGVGHAFGETCADGGRDAAFTGVNGTDGLDQLFARGRF